MSQKKRSLRKPAVQVEMELPISAGFSGVEADPPELAWWQKPATVVALAAALVLLLVLSVV